MAMLAGPRRKQKVINLRAKNNDWSNDSNKFGQRMLEKMGWSTGKGLGAKENGIVEHVVARYKNDDKGLGFEDRNDQWTKHEDDFNALLANLSNGDKNNEKIISGVSLEDKSKQSKARVHYHKFTRGKDLSRYSEKDLANIFGKKSFKNKQEMDEPLTEDVKTTEQVFTDKGSMEDYFKNKLAAMQTQNKVSILDDNKNQDEDADYIFRGFSGTNDELGICKNHQVIGFQSFSFYNNSTNQICKEDDSVPNEEICHVNEISKKKKKKKKKSKDQDVEPIVENCEDEKNKKLLHEHNVGVDSNELDGDQIKLEKKTPKKKHLKKIKKDKYLEESLTTEVKYEENLPKNKDFQFQEDEEPQKPITHEDEPIPKKKKKRKNKEIQK